jgi:hypothetical protein
LNIASGYTGIDRDYLKFIRKQCGHYTPGTEVTTMIHLDDSPVIYGLLIASRALKLRTNSSTDVVTILMTKHYNIPTVSEVKAFPLSLTTRCSSVIWIGCEGGLAESIPT